MYDLISIGSVVKDIVVLTDRGKIFKTPKDRLAPEWLGFELGEKIRADEIEESLGGVATDLAIGTKRLGLNSTIISTIGTDYEWITKELKRHKINTEYIAADKNRQTASVILVDKNSGERVILYNKSSGTIDVGKLDKLKTKWLSVSSLTGKWSRQANKIISYVKRNNTGLILLPSTSQLRDDFADLKKLLKISRILILNRNEATEVASKAKIRKMDVKSLFNLLHNLGPEIVCITDGTKGAWASDGKSIQHSPIKKVKTVDVTGAGDAFASGFLGFYLKGKTIEASLRAGIINSASVVQYIGTTKGLLTRKDIEKNKFIKSKGFII
jgi:sugar/nucleoside kinase (ribokinase family)